jgi:nucleoid-associated protein YgaU
MPAPELLSELARATSEQIVGSNSLDQPEAPRSLTLQPKAEEKPAPAVGFASIDYEDADQKSMVFINGIGTPGSRVGVYINNKFAGFAVADASGSWSFSDNRQLDAGKHALRADVLDKETNKVLARAEVSFDREPTSATKTAVFDQGSKLVGLPAGSQIQEASAIDTKPKVVVVKRGDTLWQIAEKYYGNGARYTQIFENNSNQIRNPHRIYPDQEFLLPDGSSSLNR